MHRTLYIGCYTDGTSRGIYRTKALHEQQLPLLAAAAANPSYLIFNRAQTRAYAVCETGALPNGGGGAVSYEVEEDGALRQTALLATGGDGPCHLCLGPDERTLFVANYGGGSVARLRLDETGKLAELDALAQHTGKGTHPQRQEAPHAHSVTLAPNHRDIWVADLGIDRIAVYEAEGTMQQPVCTLPLPPASGPRHLVFHPTLPFAYSVQELSNTVAVIALNATGRPAEILQMLPTLPASDGGEVEVTAAAIKLSADAVHLYVSNRGHNSVAVYSISSTGELAAVQYAPSGGDGPRDIALSPDGRVLYCAHQYGGGITALQVGENGALHPLPLHWTLDSPVCLQFSVKNQ